MAQRIVWEYWKAEKCKHCICGWVSMGRGYRARGNAASSPAHGAGRAAQTWHSTGKILHVRCCLGIHLKEWHHTGQDIVSLSVNKKKHFKQNTASEKNNHIYFFKKWPETWNTVHRYWNLFEIVITVILLGTSVQYLLTNYWTRFSSRERHFI